MAVSRDELKAGLRRTWHFVSEDMPTRTKLSVIRSMALDYFDEYCAVRVEERAELIAALNQLTPERQAELAAETFPNLSF